LVGHSPHEGLLVVLPWQDEVWGDDTTTPEVEEAAGEGEALENCAIYLEGVVGGDDYPEDIEINYVGAVKCSSPEQDSDYVMIDSGVQVCVCGENYAPECKILKVQGGLPDLRTLNGSTIKVCGIKFVDYKLSKKNKWMTVKYYVCGDIGEPVIGTSGLENADYSTVFDKQPDYYIAEKEFVILFTTVVSTTSARTRDDHHRLRRRGRPLKMRHGR